MVVCTIVCVLKTIMIDLDVWSMMCAIFLETGDFTGRKATEADWTDPDKAPPYTKSKTLAEKAAWDLVANQPGKDLPIWFSIKCDL